MRFWRCVDERAEAAALAAEIERLVFHQGAQPGRIAVLIPSLPESGRVIAGALQERAIPHQVQGAGALLLRREVRDALAWVRLLLNPDDAGAAARALLAPPVQMRHVDLAQVVQIARRRRLDLISALPAAIESPQVPPEARERIQRFLQLHQDFSAAIQQLRPTQFVDRLIDQLSLRKGGPLTGEVQIAEAAASVAWLQDVAAGFERSYPWAGAREVSGHLVALGEAGPRLAEGEARPRPVEDEAGPRIAEGAARPRLADGEAGGAAQSAIDAVQIARLCANAAGNAEHVFAVGLQEDALQESEKQALEALLQSALGSLVLSYRERSGDGSTCLTEGASQPATLIQQARVSLQAPWEDVAVRASQPEELIEASLRTLRQELLDGVASIGARLGELRLDTEIDVSHGVVRYLELVKLAALLERPQGQSIQQALSDVNARLLAAVTPLQREILESSSLDEELLSGRASAAQLSGSLPLAAGGEPSLQRFLPRKGEGLLLSASDIETYRSCPLRYKFARVLRIPTEQTIYQRFGIVVHQALERYHAAGGGTQEQLIELLSGCWRRARFRDTQQEIELWQKADSALRRYHQRLQTLEGQPLWFERSFSFSLGRHRVRGRVDRVDRLPDGSHELIDYKTGRPKRQEQLRNDIQLTLYALAAGESWRLEQTRQSYYHLLDDVKVPLPDGGAHPDWVKGVVVEVGEAILQERFEPTPSKEACSLCDYKIVCPVAEG